MAPTPLPTPDSAPTLDANLASKNVTSVPTNLFLGPNATIYNDSSKGFQTTLPMITSNAVYSNGLNILSGTTSSYYLKGDNLTIDNLGNLSKVGAITSTGDSSFSGLVNVGSLNTAGSLSAGSVSATNGFSSTTGNYSTTSGNFVTSTGKVSTKELQVAGTKFSVDSLAGTLNLNGDVTSSGLKVGTKDVTPFYIDSATGAITTNGNIKTTDSGSVTAAGGFFGSAITLASGKFKVDSLGEIKTPFYNIYANGNIQTNGTLSASAGAFVVNASGDLTSGNIHSGTINSGAITSTGDITADGSVHIGNNAVVLSNNGTSYFANSVKLGAASGAVYPISLNAADGSASFASNKMLVGADGSLSLVNGATQVTSDGSVKIGTNKISLDSTTGNAVFAGSASFAGGNAVLSASGNATLAGSMNAAGDVGAGGLLNVAGKATLSSGLEVTGALTHHGAATISDSLSVGSNFAVSTNKFKVEAASGNTIVAGTLAASGAVTADSTLNVTGAATMASTLAVTSNLSVNGDKFKVTASNGNASMAGDLSVTGNANFSGNQFQLKSDGSVYAKNYLKTDFAYGNYEANAISSNDTITTLPAIGTPEDAALFNSTTNKLLTTQEYVDRAVSKQAARLNLITKDVDANLATFNNFSKVLAAIEGSSAATIMNGLVDSVDDIRVSVSDLMGAGYNSIVINCVPSVWGDAAAPEPIPAPISRIYKEDGWFYSNLSEDSKINWYLPAYSGLKIKDITNLFMNHFLLSSLKLPKITIYTKPKNNSSDTISGVYNAKIEYYFASTSPASDLAQRSSLYIIDSPKNVYSDKSNDIKSGYSKTTKGSGAAVTTPITSSTIFSNSFDTTLVSGEDYILTFAIESKEENIKDFMFILQSFNVSTKNGTTQMMFQNSNVVNDYLFKYFFRQHTDFSDVSLDSSNLVDKNNYSAFSSAVISNSVTSIPSSSIVNPQSHITNITSLSLGGKPVTFDHQTLSYFPVGTLTATLVCNLENNTNKLKIMNGMNVITDASGDFNGSVNLIAGDNNFVVTLTDVAADHTYTTNFTAHVITDDTRLDTSTLKVNNNVVAVDSRIIVPAGTTSVNVQANAKSLLASVLITGTTGLQTGDNIVNIKVTAESGASQNYRVTIHVQSADTGLSTFNVNGGSVVDGSSINFPAGTTSVSVVAVPTAQSAGATAVISGNTGLVEGDNTLSVLVTAENGATRTYHVILHVMNDNANMSAMSLNGNLVDIAASRFEFSSTTSSVSVNVIPASSKSSIVVTGATNLQLGQNTMQVKITSEQGTTQTYTYTLYRLSGSAVVSNITINGQSLIFDSNEFSSITLSNYSAVTTIVVNATAHGPLASLTYSLNGADFVPLESGTNTTITQVMFGGLNSLRIRDTDANNNVYKTCSIEIHNLSSNADLALLTATYSDYPVVNLLQTPIFNVGSGLGASVDVDIQAATSSSNSSVTIDGVTGLTKTINVLAGTTRDVAVVVTAQDGVTTHTYNVSISMPAQPSNDASLMTFTYSYNNDNTTYYDGYLDNTMDLDKNNHNIVLNKTFSSVMIIKAIPTSAYAKIKYTTILPNGYRSGETIIKECDRTINTDLEQYFLSLICSYGTSNVLNVEVTAQDGTINNYSVTINVSSLETRATFLNDANYLNYVNANGLGPDNYFAVEAVSFGSSNECRMVTLLSNSDNNPLYGHSENGYIWEPNTRKYRIVVSWDNGATWKDFMYKSRIVEYATVAGVLFTKYNNDSIFKALPVYSNSQCISFAFLYTNRWEVINGNSFTSQSRYVLSYATFTLFILNKSENVFYRFTNTAPTTDYSPSNISNLLLAGVSSSMYNYLMPIQNFVYNDRPVPSYYFDYNNTIITNWFSKGKFMVFLNYISNFRSTFVAIQAYDSDGTTQLNIDNLTFTNVVYNATTNQIEFTSSTGDKYINMASDPNPVVSKVNNTYYNIQKYVAAVLPNIDLFTLNGTTLTANASNTYFFNPTTPVAPPTIVISTSNTTSLTINGDQPWKAALGSYGNGTNGVYSYTLQGSGLWTIVLSNNGVTKTYYLNSSGF